MVKPSGTRLVYFLFGASVGLLIGGSFFIFKIDEYLSRVELFTPGVQDTIIVTENEGDKGKKSGNEKWQDTRQYNKLKADKNSEADSLAGGTLDTRSDTTGVDSSGIVTKDFNNNDEVIEVKKDELVQRISIPVSNYQPLQKSQKDSMLQNVSGIRDDTKSNSSYFQVEFWESPVNYRGYKMTKNKLVLFGIAPPGDVRIYKIDDAYYLRHQAAYYKIEFSGEFRGFEKVSDAGVIAKLN